MTKKPGGVPAALLFCPAAGVPAAVFCFTLRAALFLEN
jgi:hypothetical protein